MGEIEVDRNIARRAGRIQRDAGLKIADALIAATALERQLPLMTRNRRHFQRVSGLTVHEPLAQSGGPAEEGATDLAPSG
ncbi:MAG TPA: PIN domain-containing protein [Solirubrobacteraceae bacterium]|nr:PIN domain-containing protein [Solirubrobacteraceae bacterium]